MPKLKVYDAKNETRLLGEIDAPEFYGDRLRMAALKATSPYRINPSLDYDRPFHIEDVEMQVQWRTKTESAGRWQRTRVEEAVLVTNASLATLSLVRSFKVDGHENIARSCY